MTSLPSPKLGNSAVEGRTSDKPSVVEVHAAMAANRLERSDLKAGAVLLLHVLVWICTFVATLWAPGFALKFMLASLLGLSTGLLFVVGHDCAHGSLFKGQRANYWAAIVAFLPSLHSPTAWDWVHNRQHHSYTNLRGKDDVYPPLTLQEWRGLPKFKQWVYRFYYTSFGIGFHYIFRIWMPLLICPPKEARAIFRTESRFYKELTLLAAFSALQVTVVVWFGTWGSDGLAWLLLEISMLIVWPFLIWKWLAAYFTILEHTHPRVRWYNNPKEWNFFDAQLGSTVHLQFPRVMEWVLSNLSEHNAHHADKRIPLYNLRESQNMLEARYPGVVVREAVNFSYLPRVLKQCRLYDYEAHRWMDFEGNYTTPARSSV